MNIKILTYLIILDKITENSNKDYPSFSKDML